MARHIIVLLATLSWLLWAADDAAVLPSSGVAAAPLTSTSFFAITIPKMLSYQGKLTDSLGNPVPDGNYQLTFRLYTQETGGSPFWTEAQTIMVRNGLFSALLGAANPIGSVPDAGVLYLSLQVGTGSELTPRLRIVSSAYAFLTERAANSDLLQGKDTTALDARYVNEGQTNSVTSAMIVDGTIVAADLNQMGAGSGQVLKWTGSAWAPSNDSIGQGDNAWVRGTPDSVLFTIRQLGIARGGSDNMLYGDSCYTHTNLGVACTTGTSGENYYSCTVGGGYGNKAGSDGATVAGGYRNVALSRYATVGGGYCDTAYGEGSTVAGGWGNKATLTATVGGGAYNFAANNGGTVGGGRYNRADGLWAPTVAGGEQNEANGNNATVGGGRRNVAR